MKKRTVYFLMLPLLCLVLNSCAQSKKLVVEARAYFMVITPGTIAVDPNGQPLRAGRDTLYSAFVETKTADLQWVRAWKGNRSYTINATPFRDRTVWVGENRIGRSKIELTPQKGHTIWQLGLRADAQQTPPPQPLTAGELLLEGKKNGAVLYHKTASWTELASPLYQ